MPHFSYTSKEEVPLGGLLSLLKTRVKEPEKLQDSFLSTWLSQAGIIHHQVGVDLSIVAADVETACRGIVFLNNLYSWHESVERFRGTESEH